jgi:carbon monoxide dehydrogenase subunit G
MRPLGRRGLGRLLLCSAWGLALARGAPFAERALLAEGTPQAQQGGFTPEERRALEQGRLVVRFRPDSTAERWLGGVSFQVLERSPAEVWRAVQDVPAYRHMLPGQPTARLDAQDGAERVVSFRHAAMGVEAAYSVRMRWNQVTRAMQFELDPSRPHDIAAAHGFLEVRAYPRRPDRTLITWGVRARLGVGLLEELFARDIETWLLRVPSTVKEHLEGRARERYLE